MNIQLKRLETPMTQKIFGAAIGLSTLLVTACGSAGLAPCQVLPSVQGGYVVKFTLNGTAAPGCAATNPTEFSDWWALNNDYDKPPQGSHGGVLIDYRSATMPYPDPPPGPPGGLYGYGRWDAEFTDDNASCTIPTIDPITGATASLDGATTHTVTFAPTAFTALSGSAYQGAEFEATVGVTVGACTGSYKAQALSPAVGCSTNKDCDPFGQPISSGIFNPFDQACYLAATHPWVAGIAAALGSDGVCFLNQPYPSIGGYKGNDQPLP